VVRVRFATLAALVALSASCGGGSTTSADPGESPSEGGSACGVAPEVEHPTYASDGLTLDLRERSPARTHGMVIPPFEFEVSTVENLNGPVEMELTIHDPTGQIHSQRFTYSNMHEVCDPMCDPVRSLDDCRPRRCGMERYRPREQRIDHTIYRGSMPGIWTFVLHRLDNDDRVSVTRRLFEGEVIDASDGEECEALPFELGAFRRASCQRGIVPLGSSTNYWGLKARYANGDCRINAFALPLSQGVKQLFFEGPYVAGEERALPEGTVREVELEGVTARAWLAHHHLYVLAAPEDLADFDAVVGALLEVFPVVGGPVREIPTCEATGEVMTRTIPPTTMEVLRENNTGYHTHFEGNRPSGARVRMPNLHPLSFAGLRRHEIIHSVNGEIVNDRQELLSALDAMTRPGRMEIVLSRQRLRHARCIKVIIDASAVPAANEEEEAAVQVRQPPPPPAVPRRGRHCERQSDACWDCVEFPFPAEVGCSAGCRRDRICVRLGGRDQCLSPTRVCCQAGASCNVPPGCTGAASSCGSATPGGRNETCTFLSDCEAPLPTP